MRRIASVLFGLSLALLPATIAFAQGGPKLPDNVAGERVYAYLEIFNTADEATVKAFFEGNFAAESLAQRPAEQRLLVTRELRQEYGMIEMRRVLAAQETEIRLLAHAEKGQWLELSFLLEPPPSSKIRGIRFEETEEPDPNEKVPKSEQEFAVALDAYLDKAVQADDFSGVVLVSKGERTVYHKAFGLANRPFSVPNRKDTKFNLGSINKLFTKVAVAQLVQRGKLSLDDKLGKLLPDYPNKDAAEKVTLRQIVAMTSGIGDFFGKKFEDTPKDRIRDNKDYLPLFASEPLLFEPGSERRYSNGGYVVLGLIVERASGKGYYDYVRENVFKPAGMGDTDSFEADVPTPNLAEGYTRYWGEKDHPGEPRRSNIYTRPARGSSAGGGYSTAEDVLRFARAIEGSKLLSPAYTQWVLGGPEPAKGDEAKTPSRAGAGGLAFAGGAPGISAFLETEGDVTIVVLTNLDPPAAEKPARKVKGWMGALGKK